MESITRVLVVDDSAYARGVISRELARDLAVEVVGTARDGQEALGLLEGLRPDVVTMDAEMPRMDGLTALERIMAERPTPVVMVSSHTSRDAEATVRALELGAVDFFLKPSPSNPAGGRDGAGLAEMVKAAARVPRARLAAPRSGGSVAAGGAAWDGPRPTPAPAGVRAIVVACSTGGPRALMEFLPALPPWTPAVLVVQHMPAGFTRSLAERLDATSALEVKEAQEGDAVRQGRVLLAPGGFHMVVGRDGSVALHQGPPVRGVRPAADVTMESVARAYGPRALAVVLTGMGSDGTRGARSIREAGGAVIVEDEATCAVYGMPRSVMEAGLADLSAPLHQVATEVLRLAALPRRAAPGGSP